MYRLPFIFFGIAAVSGLMFAALVASRARAVIGVAPRSEDDPMARVQEAA